MVAHRPRFFANDEELAKRDDDHKPGNGTIMNWTVKPQPRWRRRRILLFAIACGLVYLFIHYIPSDLKLTPGRLKEPPPHQHRRARPGPLDGISILAQEEEQELPGHELAELKNKNEAAANLEPTGKYDGPIKFYSLASTLQNTQFTKGSRTTNQNVLFAASDLRSLNDLVPMACEMSTWNRNHVHMVVMGKEDMPIEYLKQVNGVNPEICDIFWHDARPDHSAQSTDRRMSLSISGALAHITQLMHPQAIITMGDEREDHFFLSTVARKVKQLKLVHIEIPNGGQESLSWLARLDASALKSWHVAGIDVLIQAPHKSSGSIIRLLKSLQEADYSGFIHPRLMIELPFEIDAMVREFLNHYQWPPKSMRHELIIRRRIPERRLTVEEASTRFIESFYPSTTNGPHLLVLSPQAELSPVFFHYLKLHLLEYQQTAHPPGETDDILGISLESPSHHLNGSSEFTPNIRPQDSQGAKEGDVETALTPFRWQAPNSNAVLFFSDKWEEVHSFLTHQQASSQDARTRSYHANKPKLISKKQHAWAELILDLMRVRGYYMHYPGLSTEKLQSSPDSLSRPQALSIIHNELYQPPEEFLTSNDNRLDRPPALLTSDREDGETVLTANKDPLDTSGGRGGQHIQKRGAAAVAAELNLERPLLRNLLSILPSPRKPLPAINEPSGWAQNLANPIPLLYELPLLDWSGAEVDEATLHDRASDEANDYRRRAGGCTPEQIKSKTIFLGSAEDLFCLDDDEKPSSSSTHAAEREPEPEPETEPPADSSDRVSSTRVIGGGGTASTVDAVVDAAHYKATARAGMQAKLDSQRSESSGPQPDPESQPDPEPEPEAPRTGPEGSAPPPHRSIASGDRLEPEAVHGSTRQINGVKLMPAGSHHSEADLDVARRRQEQRVQRPDEEAGRTPHEPHMVPQEQAHYHDLDSEHSFDAARGGGAGAGHSARDSGGYGDFSGREIEKSKTVERTDRKKEDVGTKVREAEKKAETDDELDAHRAVEDEYRKHNMDKEPVGAELRDAKGSRRVAGKSRIKVLTDVDEDGTILKAGREREVM